MAVTKIARNDTGPFVIANVGNVDWYCDTTAEIPTSGMTEGDTVYDRQTDTLLIATSATTTVALSGGSGLSLGATPSTQAFGDTPAGGTALTASKNDHVHGMPSLGVSPTTQAFSDTPAGGSAVTAAKSDHRHGMPANPAPAFATPALTLGTANAAGAATTVIRSNATIAAFDTTAPVSQAFDDASNTGTAAVAARRDHRHGMPASPVALIVVRKTADESVTSSTVLQSDNELLYTMTANHTWAFRLVVRASSAAGSALKSNFSVPAAATWYALGLTHGGAGTSFESGGADFATAGLTAGGRISVVEGIVACGATPGNFQYQWAQVASSATPLVISADSYLQMTFLV